MKRLGLAILLMAVFSTALVGKASAATQTCSGTLPAGTYSGISVPDNTTCTIAPGTSVTVNGGITVGVEGTLNVFGNLTLNGMLVEPNDATVYAPAPAQVLISGSVLLGYNSELRLNSDGAPFTDTIGGSLNGTFAAHARVVNTTISGGVSMSGGGDGGVILLKNDHVFGNVFVIGYGGTFVGMLNNIVNGNVSLFNNHVNNDLDVFANLIGGNLACSGNTPQVDVSGNAVFGQSSGQCS